MTLAEIPQPDPTWQMVGLNDVLSRLSSRLETTASLIARVEGSLGILIRDARGLTPDLIRDLQQIDLAQQSIGDISRVLRLVSGLNTGTTLDRSAVASVMQLHDLAAQVLCDQPHPPDSSDPDHDSICWF